MGHPDDPISAHPLGLCQHLEDVAFPIRHQGPLRPRGRPARLLYGAAPAVRFARGRERGCFPFGLLALLARALANSPIGTEFVGFWQNVVAGLSLAYWVNDGLMAIFFLLVGLELKRELLSGELSNLKKSSSLK